MVDDRTISKLPAAKRALLKRMLARSAAGREAGGAHEQLPRSVPQDSLLTGPIQKVSRERELAPSPAQRRFWFLDQLEPGRPIYNVPLALRFRAPADPRYLEEGFKQLARRHEILRAAFRSVAGQPVLVIRPELDLKLAVEDLEPLPGQEREDRVRERIDEEIHRAFDLERGPLMRVALLRVSPDDHVLIIVLHHIISDGWSIEVLLRDLWEIISGRAEQLPVLPIQYADFAAWQNECIKKGYLEAEASFWKQQLDGLHPVLELPADYPRPVTQSYEGAMEQIVLPPDFAGRLHEFSRQRSVTLFMTLLAAFQTLLHRYTGEEDIAVGTPVAGRTRSETEELIGLFVNTLILRTNLGGGPSFAELLSRVRRTTLAAYEHQAMPFERLVEELKPPRDPSRNPLIQVMIVADNVPPRTRAIHGVPVTILETVLRTVKFDLTLSYLEREDGLRLRIGYRTDLFHPATIARMLEHYRNLLEEMLRDAAQPVSTVPLLGAAERRQLLVEWNDTAADYLPDRCLHEWFEIQAERTPEATAVMARDGQLTYRELNRRANCLSQRLRRLGVKPETLVALYVARSLEMVVGLLGILKAGGAYVPMEPEYPRQRLSLILEDTHAPVLVTQKAILPSLPSYQGHIVCLDDEELDSFGGSEAEEGNVPSGVRAGNLAYVIYTSGSTGKPKGVLIEHRSVVNYVLGLEQRLGLEGALHFAMVQPLSVDSSVTSIFPPLFRGGCLHVISKERALDPHALADYFSRYPADVLKIAPSHLAALVDATSAGRILPRRYLIIGGEASSPDWVDRLRRMAGGCKVFNHYGPTEATVGVTTYEISEKGARGAATATVPIGRPLPNTRLYILDRNLQPVPVGVPGQLYIGGGCLARGYLNLPEITRRKFIKDPFNSAPEALLYGTGDWVRWLPDGNVEFLGRVDHQVKIRGFRVEPGEIEAVLGRHPAVADAVVVTRREADGPERLVGYVVPKAGKTLRTEDVREHLQRELPDHMVPSALVPLAELPRTPHGKVDRKALPAPEQARPGPLSDAAVPSDEVEIRLAKILERILDVRPVELRDNFFEIGGHSLLAVILFHEIEKTFGRRLPLAVLFESPTVEKLARVLGNESRQWSSLVPLQPAGINPIFFCVHANGGNVLFYRDLARHMKPDYPFYGLQAAGMDGARPLPGRVEDMAAHYIREIRTVQPEGPYHLGGFCIGAYVALEMAHQLQAQGEDVALLVSLSTSGRWKTIRSYGEGIRFHAGNLASLDLLGKLSYMKERLSYRVFRLQVAIAQALSNHGRISGERTPSAKLLLARTFATHIRASREYHPSLFRGKLTYFRAGGDTDRDPEPFWSQAVTGGIEIHDVPGKYLGMFSEQNAPALAAELKACINRAKSKDS